MSLLSHPRFMEAVELHKAGRFDEAGRAYQLLIEENPNDPDLWHFKGLLALHRGNADEAQRLISLAIVLKPGVPDFFRNLALAHEALGNAARAAESWNKAGNASQEQCRFADAIAAYDRALAAMPDFHSALVNRGAAWDRLGQYGRAAADFRALLALVPHPASAEELLNVANALSGLGDAAAALPVYDRLLELQPDNATAHCSKSLLLLRLGDLARGWNEYEWRWSRDGGFKEPRGHFRQPAWQCQPPKALDGKLLVIAEQGLGDVIQFARYVPLLAEQGHDVIFETLPELTTLFMESFDHPRIRVVPRVDTPLEIQDNLPFAAWVGVMSLPQRFGTDTGTIPADVPYLKVDGAKAERWRCILNGTQNDAKRKIGLVWAGNPKNLNDFARSIPPEKLAPLWDAPGVRYYSLQKGPAAAYDFGNAPLVKLGDKLTDFTETAAVILGLDLVICVDTSVAHLAGALGRPVWLLIPAIPDWRWLNQGDTTAWYPTMRIFRQTARGEWADVVERVADELKSC